ncbi:MAG: hypothetical protein LBH00_09365 [Planctomycetaceae bacterium]|jgi:predicted ATPase|nr:hypothetical protein [Planctomycetaceae bacterium]
MSVPPAYPLVEGFWVRNYKALRQIAIGSCFQQSVVADFSGDAVPYDLTPLTVFAGDGGVGKSTLLDAFAFLADSLKGGIDEALARRGGFDRTYHFGGTGPISIGVVYRPCAEPRSLTYVCNIDAAPGNRKPFIETEALIYRDHQPGMPPKPVLLFQNGEKTTRLLQPWTDAKGSDLELIKRTDSRHLALALLGRIEDLPDIPLFKQLLERFFVSCYTSVNTAGLSPAKFKSPVEGNLALDLKRIKEKHPFEFTDILNVIAKRMPGLESITLETTEAGRSFLSFKVIGSDVVMHPLQIGEGTMRLLSHFTLLEDPIPTPLLGLEEPAAFMGRSQLMSFVQHLQRGVHEIGGTQYFMTTNNNMLIDQMDPTNVWFLSRNESGTILTHRGLDELQFLGVDINTVGPFWYSEYLYREYTSSGMMASGIRPPQ